VRAAVFHKLVLLMIAIRSWSPKRSSLANAVLGFGRNDCFGARVSELSLAAFSPVTRRSQPRHENRTGQVSSGPNIGHRR
jgi:hypothetical protein